MDTPYDPWYQWGQANKKYFQWHRLDFMADTLHEEGQQRADGNPPVLWPDYDGARLERVRGRIERALAAVACPDYQPMDEPV